MNFLRKTGSVSVQVTILTPSVGSKGYEEPFEKGMVIQEARGTRVEDYQYDGNHCIATDDPNPWRKQMNIYLAYASFYNPINLVKAISAWKDPRWTYRVMYQAYGMAGLAKSMKQGWGWFWDLYKGPVEKQQGIPRRRLEMIPPPVAPSQPAAPMQYQTA